MNDAATRYAEPILIAVEAAEGRLAPKKRLLVTAAISCFAEHGYAATSTRMIATRAGVAEATIFRHYPTKKDLLLRLVEPVLDQLILPGIDVQQSAILDQEKDIHALLRWVLQNRLNYARAFAPLVRIVVQEMPVNPELRALVVGRLGPKMRVIVAQNLERLRPDRRFSQTDIDRLLRTATSLLIGYFLSQELSDGGQPVDDTAEIEIMVDMIYAGFLSGPDAG